MSSAAIELWSGGQTGVDRAAFDVALELGLPIGGWIPQGRLAEDGRVPPRYTQLREAHSPDYTVRTRLNVQDTHGTLVLTWGPPRGGTEDTVAFAHQLARPVLVIDLALAELPVAADTAGRWLAGLSRPGSALRLNVAGPRASQAPEAYERARQLLRLVLQANG
jgi:hypothetical protein